MSARVEIRVDGNVLRVEAGISVAAALLNAGYVRFRASTTREPRAPLCGMGVCFECRVTINSESHIRACMVPVADGMEVKTGA